jgi:hypothetical protein
MKPGYRLAVHTLTAVLLKTRCKYRDPSLRSRMTTFFGSLEGRTSKGRRCFTQRRICFGVEGLELGGLGVEDYFGPAFVAVVEVFVGFGGFG